VPAERYDPVARGQVGCCGRGPALAPAMIQIRQPAPRLAVSGAIARPEALGHEFLFFDTDTSRGSLTYHRCNGHYGLIVPADAPH